MTVSSRAGARPMLAEITDIIDRQSVHAVYQPIADLDALRPVGYEALARGPSSSALERPRMMFEAARKCGRVAELDWICRAAAVRGALAADLRAPYTLFLNVEPDALHTPVPQELKETWLQAMSRLCVVLEVTESALTAQPTELLWSVESVRELGWGVALDDVGDDARSPALLSFLRPDVIKLDLGLIRRRPRAEVARVAHAVAATSERTGAAILAEGVECEGDLETARALGATLAQGWLFGRPRPLPARLPAPGAALAIAGRSCEVPVGRTPFDILARDRRVRRGSKRVLLAMSRHVERQADAFAEHPVVLATLQDERFLTAATRARYERLAARASFVAVFGAGMRPAPAPGVRGVRLLARDPLRGEWVVVVIAPHFTAALAARDVGDEGCDADRRFDYVLTHRRESVVKAASSLMARVLAL